MIIDIVQRLHCVAKYIVQPIVDSERQRPSTPHGYAPLYICGTCY